MASNAPSKVVARFYEALARGDGATALDCWADNAVWHATGRSDLAGDYEPDAYLAMLGEWNHLALLHGEPRYLTAAELEVYNADQRFPMRGWEYYVSRLDGKR